VKDFLIRSARMDDLTAAYYICLKTGDFGNDGEPYYRDDPDALARIFVGPYFAYEPESAIVLEDTEGVCGYALAALDSKEFYARYDAEWRMELCRNFPAPQGDPCGWSRTQKVYSWYHKPDYFMPEPYRQYPSHLHIDLLPRAQGKGLGRGMMERLFDILKKKGSAGVHLGVSEVNQKAVRFYQKLGFQMLVRQGEGTDACLYMGMAFVTI